MGDVELHSNIHGHNWNRGTEDMKNSKSTQKITKTIEFNVLRIFTLKIFIRVCKENTVDTKCKEFREH